MAKPPTDIESQSSIPGMADLAVVALVRRSFETGAARSARERAGLSVGELARAAGLPPSTLARWERGERHPRAVQALRAAPALAELLGLAEILCQEAP